MSGKAQARGACRVLSCSYSSSTMGCKSINMTELMQVLDIQHTMFLLFKVVQFSSLPIIRSKHVLRVNWRSQPPIPA